uniref:Uncharacterized protein n=1 Tax=viral metagenome TaxID=1070528 RepID=A0A6C0B342_9ZZZZ
MQTVHSPDFFEIGKSYTVALPHPRGEKGTVVQGVIKEKRGRQLQLKTAHGFKQFEVDYKDDEKLENLQAQEETAFGYGGGVHEKFAGRRRRRKTRKTRRRHTRRR